MMKKLYKGDVLTTCLVAFFAEFLAESVADMLRSKTYRRYESAIVFV